MRHDGQTHRQSGRDGAGSAAGIFLSPSSSLLLEGFILRLSSTNDTNSMQTTIACVVSALFYVVVVSGVSTYRWFYGGALLALWQRAFFWFVVNGL